MNSNRIAIAFLSIAFLGCAPQSQKDTLLADSVEYYEVTGNGASGAFQFNVHMAGRRTLKPSEKTILETFEDLDNGDVHDLTIRVDLEENTFSMTYDDGSYEGTGTLYGEAWNWHAWESVSFGVSGERIESVDEKDENGIVADKVGYNADGEEEWHMREILTPISKEEWQDLQEVNQ